MSLEHRRKKVHIEWHENRAHGPRLPGKEARGAGDFDVSA